MTTGQQIPSEWDVKSGKNIRWSMPTGSSNHGGIVVANGKVYLGTNNDSAYVKRFPNSVDLGVLLCFDEKDGTFFWQHSNSKLPTGRVHDWPEAGVCSAPLVVFCSIATTRISLWQVNSSVTFDHIRRR